MLRFGTIVLLRPIMHLFVQRMKATGRSKGVEAAVAHRCEQVALDRGGDLQALTFLPQPHEQVLHQVLRAIAVLHVLQREGAQRPIVRAEHLFEGVTVASCDAGEFHGSGSRTKVDGALSGSAAHSPTSAVEHPLIDR